MARVDPFWDHATVEALLIRLEAQSINREIGFNLSNCWNSSAQWNEQVNADLSIVSCRGEKKKSMKWLRLLFFVFLCFSYHPDEDGEF